MKKEDIEKEAAAAVHYYNYLHNKLSCDWSKLRDRVAGEITAAWVKGRLRDTTGIVPYVD